MNISWTTEGEIENINLYYKTNENFMRFSLFKMLKNRWDQVKIPASEIRFSKTFRFVAQMDAFLENLTFWAPIRLCFTTRIAWRFSEA